MKVKLISAFAACALIASTGQAAELVVNGGFEITTNGVGQLGYNTNAFGWTTNGYNFLFSGNTADTLGANGSYGNLKLWGPGNGANNGLSASPTGGNYIAADGAFGVKAVSQTINGLTAGKDYVVSFDWAGAQQYRYDGANTERWQVSLGNETKLTSVYNNPNHGFSGWTHESFTFTAQSTSALLSFLAHGTPEGVPPFSLLDGVSMQAAAVPEPTTWMMMLGGFGLIGGTMRRRRNAVALDARS